MSWSIIRKCEKYNYYYEHVKKYIYNVGKDTISRIDELELELDLELKSTNLQTETMTMTIENIDITLPSTTVTET